MTERVDQLCDGLGKPIDSGIKETVAAFNVLGFSTVASCEGHLNWGIAAPWVQLENSETLEQKKLLKKNQKQLHFAEKREQEGADEAELDKLFSQYHETRRQYETSNILFFNTVLQLLTEFYAQHNCEYQATIILQQFGRNGCRVISVGAMVQDVLPEQEREKWLVIYRMEMQAFASFLKQIYFDGEQ